DRLEMFMGGVKLERLALNMDQVEKYQPPPNPAKLTDSRANAYVAEFGDDSWELDALEPKVLVNLIRTNVNALKDKKKWAEDEKRLKEEKELLQKVSDDWERISEELS